MFTEVLTDYQVSKQFEIMNDNLNYTLPDLALIEYAKTASQDPSIIEKGEFRYMVFQPVTTAVVLGQSNSVEKSVHLDRCLADNIEIMKRPSGGEAVLISPKTLIISFCIIDNRLPKSSEVFDFALQSILNALKSCGISKAEFRGISDIAIEGKKVLGCAIYRRPHMVLYHGVLNVSEDPQRIGYYLQHPSKEPDYRGRRDHESFITSLANEGFLCSVNDLKVNLQRALATAYSAK